MCFRPSKGPGFRVWVRDGKSCIWLPHFELGHGLTPPVHPFSTLPLLVLPQVANG